MSTGGTSSKTPPVPVVTHRSKLAGTDDGRQVICTEFKRAKYLFKCASCGALHGKHCTSKAKVDDSTGIKDKEEHLPPRKRLLLRFELEQKATAASWEKDKEEGELELEEGETSWSPDGTINKGKRAPRRRRADAP
jgi:hypothetical protein